MSLARATADLAPTRQTIERRLVDAVTAVAADDGFAALTVERVLCRTGVSRASFYHYFQNIEDCFRVAYRYQADRLLHEINAWDPCREDQGLTPFRALVNFAVSQPDAARVLMIEGLASGRLGLEQRTALIGRLNVKILAASRRRPIDLPPDALMGGVFRFLATRLTDGQMNESAWPEVRQWVEAFSGAPAGVAWSTRLADTLSRGMPTTSAYEVAGRRPEGSPRERILRATASVICDRGYRYSTVADVVKAARVSRRVFYKQFADKRAAFITAYEYGFERALAACTPAFFSSGTWPERVWRSGIAFTRFLASEPQLARLGLVHCYAPGPSFHRRIHETQLAFTWFLEEGCRLAPDPGVRSPGSLALTAMTIAELGGRAVRHSGGIRLRILLPIATYVALAPYVGAADAGRFVKGKLVTAGHRTPAGA